MAEKIKVYSNTLQVFLLTQFEDCERCDIANEILEKYSELVEGAV